MARLSPLARQLVAQGLDPLRRHDGHGPLRLMAAAEGYVMCRRPGAMPHVMPLEKWMALPSQERAA